MKVCMEVGCDGSVVKENKGGKGIEDKGGDLRILRWRKAILRICHLSRNLSSVRSKPSQYLRSGHFWTRRASKFKWLCCIWVLLQRGAETQGIAGARCRAKTEDWCFSFFKMGDITVYWETDQNNPVEKENWWCKRKQEELQEYRFWVVRKHGVRQQRKDCLGAETDASGNRQAG